MARLHVSLVVAALLFCVAIEVAASSAFDDGIAMVTDSITAEEEQLLGGGLLDTASALMNAEARFKAFVKKYGKIYTGESYAHRLSVFTQNLIKAVEHQTMDPGAVHGITKFFDLTAEEFEQRYMGLNPAGLKKRVSSNVAPKLPTDNLPEEFDWRDYGAVTGVKDQVRKLLCFEQFRMI
jgi:cathepsin F